MKLNRQKKLYKIQIIKEMKCKIFQMIKQAKM